MAIIRENLGPFDAALLDLENATQDARKETLEVKGNLDFENDLTQPQIDARLARITSFAQALQSAVTAAQTIFQATTPVQP